MSASRHAYVIVRPVAGGDSGAVWQRHGRCAEVLTELLALPHS